jgi:hypothetical protein
MHQRKPWLWGPLSLLGLGLATTTLAIDQAHKWWMLGVFDIQIPAFSLDSAFNDIVPTAGSRMGDDFVAILDHPVEQFADAK